MPKQQLISVKEAELLGFAISPENLSYGEFTEPKHTSVGYKLFYQSKDGKLYPPVIANKEGTETKIGEWLPASCPEIVGYTKKEHRPKVLSGGIGTRGKGLGYLAFRPGWHLSTIPYAPQFFKREKINDRNVWPHNLVWGECLYGTDIDYQEESDKNGYTLNGKFRHSYCGLKRIPKHGFYRYRTNPIPGTTEWIIAGEIFVKRIIPFDEINQILTNYKIEAPIII